MSQFPADPDRSTTDGTDPFDELTRLINGDAPAAAPVPEPPALQSDHDIQAAMEGRATAPIVPPSGVHQVPTRGPLAQVAREAPVESPLDAVFDLTALRAAFENAPIAPAEPIPPVAEPQPTFEAAPAPAPMPVFDPMPVAEASPTDVAEIVEPPQEFATAPDPSPVSSPEPAPAMFADMQAMMDADVATPEPALPEASFEIDLEQELEAALMSDLAAVEPEPIAVAPQPQPQVQPVQGVAEQTFVAERPHGYPPARNGRRRAVAMTAALTVMGASVLVFYSLLGDGTAEEAPVILADAGPTKVKPDEAGGAAVPNQDTALFKSETKPHQDALRSGTETPVEVALAPRPVKVKTQIRRALPPSARKVRTVVVKPDGTIVSGKAVVGAVPPRVAKAAPVEAPAKPPVRNVSTAKPPAELVAAEPVWDAPEAPKVKVVAPKRVVKVEPAPAVKKVEPKEVTRKARPSNGYVVQISSRRSPESARSAFKKLQKRYRKVLGGRDAQYQKTDIAGKGTFYRVRVLADSKSDAGRLCRSLKRAGGSCFVTR